jgi:hypothetical protein
LKSKTELYAAGELFQPIERRITSFFNSVENNTLGQGEYKILACTGICSFLIWEKIFILVPLAILYYSHPSIFEEGNDTFIVWKGNYGVGEVEGAHILCVHIVESPFPIWNIYHVERETSTSLIKFSKQSYFTFKL